MMVSGTTTVTGNYVTQYKLTLTTNPSGVGVGNISGGTNGAFYDAGTSLTLQATTPVSDRVRRAATASTTGRATRAVARTRPQ